MRILCLAFITLLLSSCDQETVLVKSSAAQKAQSKLDSKTIEQTRVRASSTSKIGEKNIPGQANAVLFITQVPTRGDEFASRGSTFANHSSHIGSVPRGGDLMIRYPNGTVRNLTREAGYGMDGQQGAQAIAVREPSVHWDGQKALFSMLIGAPNRYVHASNPWQIYEVSGLGQGQTVSIRKIPGQPNYNNVSPIYTSDDKILFTSDRPYNGQNHLHPQLDEYESTPTIVGIYKLDPQTQKVSLLNHTPSGAFSPTIDSYGRVVFIRWDHLQRDQQHDAGYHGAVNFASEAANASSSPAGVELFPESRTGMSSSYGAVNGFTYNLFTPWQMNQDGTEELSLNHIGRHELTFGYLPKSFANDSHLQDNTGSAPRANNFYVRMDGGLFNMREDPNDKGSYLAVYSREFYELASGRIVKLRGPVGMDAEKMTITPITPEISSSAPGRYRNPVPMTDGTVVASYLPVNTLPSSRNLSVRLVRLTKDAQGNLLRQEYLTGGISKSVSWWDPDNSQSFNGELWELEPVEVVQRSRPPMTTLAIEPPEKSVFDQEGVDEAQFRNWMKEKNLAMMVVRNQTHRDRADRQQPFNLRVPGGVSTTATNGPLYDISHFQIFQADLVRGYSSIPGRRPLAQPMKRGENATYNGPAGSVGIYPDGSSAAFVPANKALSWQTTDANGEAIVRERLWITFQPGEIRACSGCHGENVVHQGGVGPSQAQTQAVRQLLRDWKATQQPQAPRRRNGSAPLLPPRG